MTTTTPPTMTGLLTLSTGEDRAEWLASRLPCVTATQAAAITGSHPYLKVIDVWNSKTDPNYDPEADRNKYLDERAAVGNEREAAILEWASALPITGGPTKPFIANRALVANPDRPQYAATPDGFKYPKRGTLVLIEAKTTQQDWEAKGLPQHVYDQCQWQIDVTGAVTVWVAVERYSWNKGEATLEGTWITKVHRDEARLAYMHAKVDQFEKWLELGQAPESDIDLTDLPELEFDDTEEQAAEKLAIIGEFAQLDADLSELAEIRGRIGADVARAAELEAAIKAVPKLYDGRRIHLIGTRLIAKLVRGTKTNIATAQLDAEVLRSITSWSETETVRIEPNPEYVPPTTTETE